MALRVYEPDRDKAAVHRIWRETGWIEAGHEPTMDIFVEACRCWVADIDEEPECLVVTAPSGPTLALVRHGEFIRRV